jgi:hypothetical protein
VQECEQRFADAAAFSSHQHADNRFGELLAALQSTKETVGSLFAISPVPLPLLSGLASPAARSALEQSQTRAASG